MKALLKTTAVAIALASTVLGAYATKQANAPKVNEDVYTWTRTNGSPEPGEQDPFVGTKTDAINNFGCDGDENECAIGEPQNPLLPNDVIYMSN